MSRGQDYSAFNARVRSALEADVGPVDGDPCGVGPCDTDAVYRVPWPQFGGDVAFCPLHLARYRKRHPDLWQRVDESVDDDLSAYATRGDRFLLFAEVPDRIEIEDEEFVLVALLATGNALYEEDDPDGSVSYVVVDRRLKENSRQQVPRDRAGEFLREVESDLGVHEWDDEVRAVLYGGEHP